MAYKLLPSKDDNKLFFRLEGEAAERHGVIGYMRADFGKTGREFWTTWFDGQPHLKTYDFKKEFEDVVNSLRDDGQEPPFASRNNLAAFCAVNPGKELNSRGCGYMVRTQDYSYYFRCRPHSGDYDVYCFAYDNRWLLPELDGQHALPTGCFSVLPSTGELIGIKRGVNGYLDVTVIKGTDRQESRRKADKNNKRLGVTRAQEEAMLAGSLFGWNTPAAKPWNYKADGTPRNPNQPKKKEPER